MLFGCWESRCSGSICSQLSGKRFSWRGRRGGLRGAARSVAAVVGITPSALPWISEFGVGLVDTHVELTEIIPVGPCGQGGVQGPRNPCPIVLGGGREG
jgi:hypothetical protein